MRRISLFLVALMAVVVASAQQKSVEVTEAGALAAQIGPSERLTTTSLKIVGPINGTDVRLLREMAGADSLGNATKGQLAELDLSEAVLTKGGDCYLRVRQGYDAFMEDNVVSSKMFYGCHALRRVVIPNSAKRVYNDSFSACANLKSIETVENETFTSKDGMLYRADGSLLYRCPQGQKIDVLVVGEGVKQLYPSACRGVSSLTEVRLPSTMYSINDMAFYGCPAIKKIVVDAANPPYMSNAFEQAVVNTAVLCVPKGSTENYRSQNGWKEFKNIVEE